MDLSKEWLTEGLLDVEYKQLKLLAYLKAVRQSFKKRFLYPDLANLHGHYNNLVAFQRHQKSLRSQFPSKVTGIDARRLQLQYQQLVDNDTATDIIDKVIAFARPQMQGALKHGQKLYEEIAGQMELTPIGLMPLDTTEGYLFITFKEKRHTGIYRYALSIFTHNNERYRSLNTHYLGNELRSLHFTYEKMKAGLIKKYKALPNPATYVIATPAPIPFEPTVLPIAKRMLVQHLSHT